MCSQITFTYAIPADLMTKLLNYASTSLLFTLQMWKVAERPNDFSKVT